MVNIFEEARTSSVEIVTFGTRSIILHKPMYLGVYYLELNRIFLVLYQLNVHGMMIYQLNLVKDIPFGWIILKKSIVYTYKCIE